MGVQHDGSVMRKSSGAEGWAGGGALEAEIAEVRRMMQCEAAQILKSSVYRGVYKGNSEPKRLLYARADFFIVTLGNILGH